MIKIYFSYFFWLFFKTNYLESTLVYVAQGVSVTLRVRCPFLSYKNEFCFYGTLLIINLLWITFFARSTQCTVFLYSFLLQITITYTLKKWEKKLRRNVCILYFTAHFFFAPHTITWLFLMPVFWFWNDFLSGYYYPKCLKIFCDFLNFFEGDWTNHF